ncbi:MAG: phosphoglucomutase/phosphomannomutase family protein [Bacteroidetes bacterium]|nr:phosphoglucomutase/phosphomannomutase family protein [Bacteroidota bacterium]MBU2584380.1 phosphoglucomutase/phosphomannomutase family protein [Bacteroidota bacterium]
MQIKFGTSGWRAVIADQFTFDNVILVTQAICDLLKKNKESSQGVIISNDTRFLGDEFKKIAAEVVASNGIKVYCTERDTPTPVVAYEIVRRKLGGGISFTASHNPAKYQGLKFFGSHGGSAFTKNTQWIETKLKSKKLKVTKTQSFDTLVDKKKIEIINPRRNYLNYLGDIIDLKAIAKSKLKIAYDAMYGTGRDYLDTFLIECGCDVRTLHHYADPNFGGINPEPTEENLWELSNIVANEKNFFGVATDGDADRFGLIDMDGSYFDPNYFLPVLLRYVLETRPNWAGSAVRTLATSHLFDMVAFKNKIRVHETPVGFKYISEIMAREEVLLAGEESGGLTFFNHIPEKDGIAACLLAIEVVAKTGCSLSELLDNIYRDYGVRVNLRERIEIDDKLRIKLEKVLKNKLPKKLLGKKVVRTDLRDGVKMINTDNDWLLIRLSGTEPIVRIHSEAKSKEKAEKLLDAAKSLL